MNRMPAFICTSILVLAVGCSPYNFTLQKETGWEIEGKKAINHHNVHVEANNLVVLEPQSGVFLRCEQLTDGIFNTEVTLFDRGQTEAEDEVTFSFRSTPYDDTVLNTNNGFTLLISNDHASVVTSDNSVTFPIETTEPGKPFRVVVKQHGQFIEATVACTFLGRYWVDSPTTQWVSIQTLGGQRVELRDPSFRPIRDDFNPDVNDLIGSFFGRD